MHDADGSDAPGARITLGVLFLVYLFNYLDRTLIYILFQPIRAELKLSELELALLGSTSFVLFYTTLGVPFGRLADRVRRTHMIAAGLAVWSAASALTGVMHGFAGIFACRVLVGVGEATLGPAALSLLSDLYPPSRRATASAAFSAGIPLGAGVALLAGGLLGARLGWRPAFYACGLPGVLLAVGVLALREPSRERVAEQPAETTPIGETLLALARARGLTVLVFGYACFATAANALMMWVPSFLVRVHHVPLETAGRHTGLLAAGAGLVGVLGGGIVADALARRAAGGRARFGALAALACAGLWVLLLRAQSPAGVLVPFAGLAALGLSWLGPAAADVQGLAGPSRRGVAIGVYFFVVNFIGYGLAPPLIGRLSDRLGVAANPEVLRTSLLVCPVAAIATAVLLFVAGRALDRIA